MRCLFRGPPDHGTDTWWSGAGDIIQMALLSLLIGRSRVPSPLIEYLRPGTVHENRASL